MKIPFAPKALVRGLVFLALLAPLASFAASNSSAHQTWVKAAKEYTEAATQQILAIRAEVDTEIKTGGADAKDRYVNVVMGLDRCDALLTQLKAAPAAQFDSTKAEFERNRGDMVKLLEAVRKAG